MQSFILLSKNDEVTEEEWKKLCKKFSVHPLEQTVINFEKAPGIEQIRDIQKNIFLFPAKGNTKALMIKKAHTMSVPAQNALLKLLEEPPEHALIVLEAPRKDSLLPTIVSRCFVLQTADRHALEKAEENVFDLSKGERMRMAQEKGSSREDALAFLEGQIRSLHEKLLKTQNKEEAEQIKNLQKAYSLVSSTNVSPRFILEVTLLSLR